MVKRIDRLTPKQQAQMAAWAQRWIEAGRRTGEADWASFEEAARACYGYAGIPWPGVVVRVQSPLIGALAAPIAVHVIGDLRRCGAVAGAVRGAVDDAVHVAVDGAVDGAVRVAVRGAVDDAVDGAVAGAVLSRWYWRLGGQWWLSWQAYTSFFRDVCGLELDGDLWDRDRAYAQAQSSAGWWWPNRDFVMVTNHPTVLHLEQVRPAGWRSHRLHCDDGPAIAWPDGWSLYFIHGNHVTRQIVEAPNTLQAAQITSQPNQEVRRIMVDRYGPDRYLRDAGGRKLTVDEFGTLWQLDQQDDEPILMVQVTNSTPEPDGSWKDYWLRVDPRCRPMLPNGGFGRPQELTPRNAVASTFGLRGPEYVGALAQQT